MCYLSGHMYMCYLKSGSKYELSMVTEQYQVTHYQSFNLRTTYIKIVVHVVNFLPLLSGNAIEVCTHSHNPLLRCKSCVCMC